MNIINRLISLVTLCVVLSISACASSPDSQPPAREAVTDLFQVSVDAQRAYRESRWMDAVRLYQMLVEQLPADASAWFYLANTYAHQGAYQAAIHAYEQSLDYNTSQPKAWFNLSRVYLLNAQSAMRQSSQLMDAHDPVRGLIAEHLGLLDDMLHGKAEPRAVSQK